MDGSGWHLSQILANSSYGNSLGLLREKSQPLLLWIPQVCQASGASAVCITGLSLWLLWDISLALILSLLPVLEMELLSTSTLSPYDQH